jgi:hypothetical protein
MPEPEPSSQRRFPMRALMIPRGRWPEPPAPALAAPLPPGSEAEPPAVEAASAPPPPQPEAPPPQPEAPPPQPEAPPREDGAEIWFEQALAELDQLSPVAEAPPAQPLDAPDLSPPDASPQAPAAEQPPEVIGRYESDGATYVMFSDGTIEARSESGVMRFESLSALRAHIETLE